MTRTKFNILLSVVSAACLSSLSAPAQAETDAPALSSEMALKVVMAAEDGTEELVERDSVRPGEIIEFSVLHSNNTELDISGLSVALPVPEGVTVAFGHEMSSIPSSFEVQAEMDPETPGLEWSGLPAYRSVVEQDGSLRREALPAEAVTAVRWNFDAALPSGETARNAYRVVVN